MKILLLLLFAGLVNAMELKDFAGKYFIDGPETRKLLEAEMATLPKDEPAFEEKAALAKQLKDNPPTSAMLTYVIDDKSITIIAMGAANPTTISEVKSAKDYVDFTMAIAGKAKKARLKVFKDDMILFCSRGEDPETTLVFRKIP